MKIKLWLSVSLLTLALLGDLSLLSPVAVIIPVTAQNRPRTTGTRLVRYVVPNEFSISYPSGWFVERTQNPPGSTPRELVIITSQQSLQFGGEEFPNNLIKTDLQILPGSFETVVNQTLSAPGEGERLTRRGSLTVGGRQALRLWFSGLEIDSIVTLVRYNTNETAYISSLYTRKNLRAIPVIQNIHASFRVLQ